MEIFDHVQLSPPFALVVNGRIYDLVNSNVSSYLFPNTTQFWRIQDGAKPFAGLVGRKNTGRK